MQKFANAIIGEQDVQNADDPTKFITDEDVQNQIFIEYWPNQKLR